MQLDQPIPPSYPDGDGQYDFILSGNKKPKKSLLPRGNSRKQRLVVILVGGGLLLALFFIILAVLLSSGGSVAKSLQSIAETQTEIVRVAGAGESQSRDITTQNFAQSVVSVITSSQQQTVSYLGSHHTKITKKELLLGQNSKTDATLKAAQEAGRYDEEFKKVLEQELNDYEVQLNQTYKQATTKSQKQLLQNLFDQVKTLQKNQPATSS